MYNFKMRVFYDKLIFEVPDDYISDVENIADYTYTLYKAKSTVKSDISTITWTFDTKDWEKVETLQMKKNEVSADPTLYTAVVKISDLEDGVYGYFEKYNNQVCLNSKYDNECYYNLNNLKKESFYLLLLLNIQDIYKVHLLHLTP